MANFEILGTKKTKPIRRRQGLCRTGHNGRIQNTEHRSQNTEGKNVKQNQSPAFPAPTTAFAVTSGRKYEILSTKSESNEHDKKM